MIRKLLLLLALLAVLAPTPARATELNSDTGFDNAGAWMKDPASPNLWTVSGSKANGNSATLMQMLMQMNSSIKEGHKYRWQVTVSSRTTGILKVGVGLSMPTTPTFTALTAPISPISDPFTTASGLHSVTALGTGDASPGRSLGLPHVLLGGAAQADRSGRLSRSKGRLAPSPLLRQYGRDRDFQLRVAA
jgi:hypothetical protein